MVYILALEENFEKVKKITCLNGHSKFVEKITIDELKKVSYVETLVVDWDCHNLVRPFYRKISIDNIAYIVGEYFIDSTDKGKALLFEYEQRALKEKNWELCKRINRIRTEFSLWKRDVILENYPNIIQIESTNVCNARCIMCKHLISNNYKGEFITMEILEKISSILPYVDVVILHGFGEPFLNPEIKEMIEYYMSFGIKLITNTNLSYLPKEIIPLINEAFYQIHVSCDGCTRETFEGIRRGISFDKFNENISLVRKRCPSVKLIMNTVMMRQNLLELADIVRYAKAKEFDEIVFMPVTVNACLDNHDDGLVHFPQMTAKAVEMAKKAAEEENIKITIPEMKTVYCEEAYREELEKYYNIPLFKTDEQIKKLQEYEKKHIDISKEIVKAEVKESFIACKGICNWLIEKVYVDLKGNVYFCCMNNDNSEGEVFYDFKIGNLGETDFKTIWNGEQYQHIREVFYHGKLPNVCVGCQFLMNDLVDTIDLELDEDVFLTRKRTRSGKSRKA